MSILRNQISIFLVAFFCVGTITAQLPSYLPVNGIVAWYPFNGNANDESGNGNNGQAQGAILTSDRFGDSNKAYSFNGNLDNITTSLQQTNISSYTVSAWFKTNHGGWILTGRQVDSGDHSIRMLVNIDGVTAGGYGVLYGTDGDGNTDNTTTVANYNDNQWHHAVGVWDGSNSSVVSQFQMKLYIDGTLVPQTPGTSVGNGGYGGHPNIPISGNSVCRFGISPGNYAPQSLIGQLDDIAIYNRALTQSEVTALYTATAANTGGGTTSTSPAPSGIPYQAEVRSDNGEVLANTNVNVRFTLHELTANGTVSYQETHTLTTNELGLFAATIGAGTATQGTFAGINWSQTTKFLQVEVDTGNGYITMGNQQLMSVPYALYAANGPAGPQGPTGAQGEPGIAGAAGLNGQTGRGIESMNINNSTLEILYSDSTSQSIQISSSSFFPNQGVRVGIGSTTGWTCPQGVSQIQVELWGGGGGGGGCNAAPYPAPRSEGGVGGSGGYNKQIVTTTPGQTYQITIGLGGTGGLPYNSGQSGGTSSFSNLLSAQGGSGGTSLYNCNWWCSNDYVVNGQIINCDYNTNYPVTSRSYLPTGYITNLPYCYSSGGGGTNCGNCGCSPSNTGVAGNDKGFNGENGYCIITY